MFDTSTMLIRMDFYLCSYVTWWIPTLAIWYFWSWWTWHDASNQGRGYGIWLCSCLKECDRVITYALYREIATTNHFTSKAFMGLVRTCINRREQDMGREMRASKDCHDEQSRLWLGGAQMNRRLMGGFCHFWWEQFIELEACLIPLRGNSYQ